MSAVFKSPIYPLTTTPSVISRPTESNSLADLVEDFVTLYNQLAPDLDTYEHLKKQLSAAAALDASNKPTSLAGHQHFIDYTAPALSLVCTVSPAEFIAETQAWSALSVSVTEARKSLSEQQLAALFKTKLGSRRFRRIR
jgi:hypothetical protein